MHPLMLTGRDFCAQRGLRAYLVGGFLRDALLGRASRDLDLAIDGDGPALARALADALGGSYVALDPEHGIGRAVVAFQGDVWLLDISTIQGGGILQDLARRDFTVDAMAVELGAVSGEPATWPLLDPTGGHGDLAAHLLRATSDAVFRDDPARLLRAVRLTAQVGFQIESSTARLVRRDAPLVQGVAPERVRDELLKTLSYPNVGAHLRLLDALGLLCLVIPEMAEGKGVSQPKEHYWNVFEHNVETAASAERLLDAQARGADPALASVPWRPWLDAYFQGEVSDGHSRATLLKLAGLLHDIAKPQTKQLMPSGRIRFLGHSEKGAAQVEAILRRLRFSGRGVELVRTAVAEHLRPSQVAQHGVLPTRRAVYRYFRDLGDAAVDTLYLSLADYLAARGPMLELDDWQQQCAVVEQTLSLGTEEARPERIPKLVDGHDLIETFALQPGPAFRSLLEALREAQAAGEVTTREEALALLNRLIRQESEPAGERHVSR